MSEEKSKSCDGNATLEELTIAVNNLKINRSPGMDGICINFYKKNLELLWTLLAKKNNFRFENKHYYCYLRKDKIYWIKFIRKNDPLELASYRPISLLKSDYKILSYTLALKINKS